jgi:hypothetical protein
MLQLVPVRLELTLLMPKPPGDPLTLNTAIGHK